MASEKELMLTKEVFNSLCKMLDDRNWKYEKEEDRTIISFAVGGEDIPMAFLVVCDAERQLIRLMSYLPFKISKEKTTELAVAISCANYSLADGSFDFDIIDGSIVFRMTANFRDSLIGNKLFEYMIDIACMAVDKYNDQFLMLNEGKLSIEDFIKNI